jgi:uncharacterized membrane protein YcjF (UPF0283 family)
MDAPANGPLTPRPWVFRTQLALLVTFSLFAGSVVLWISRLIYISWQLEDVFSASIGIALVAVPVFVFLLIMFNYVFWGLRRGRRAAVQPSVD